MPKHSMPGRELLSKVLLPPLPIFLILEASAALFLYAALAAKVWLPFSLAAACPLSTYGLVICLARLRHWAHILPQRIPLLGRLLADTIFRQRFAAVLSLAVSLAYLAFCALEGIRTRSLWYPALAMFHGVIAAIRLLITLYRLRGGGTPPEEWRLYRRCARLLSLPGIVVIAFGLLQMRVGPRIPAGYLIYGTAAYTFFCLGTSLRSLLPQRRQPDPAAMAGSALSRAHALISLFTLQAALIADFGEAGGSFYRITGILCGTAVFALLLLQSALMLRRYRREGPRPA